jgi:uncharacterized protein (DUF2344 family)
MDTGATYKVIVAPSADHRYVNAILPYLDRNFSFNRLIEIDEAIDLAVHSLKHHPHRGSRELLLEQDDREYRYILFRETRHFELKILYFIEEHSSSVFVVDYFPTAMHPRRMTRPRL